MKKFSFVFFTSLLSLILLSGCGQNSLESGSYISDAASLNTGGFSICEIDTSYIPGNLNVNGLYSGDSEYGYVFSSYDIVSNFSDYYLIRFDTQGNELFSGSLDLPFSIRNDRFSYSDKFSDSFSIDLSKFDYANISYFGFDFDDNGNISADCELYGYLNSNEIPDGMDLQYYKVNWNSNGECVSVTECDSVEYSYYEYKDFADGKDGNIYKFNPTGISVFDSDLNYVSEYFDFINSGVLARNFDAVIILNNDSFSGLYRDLEGNEHLACFNRLDDRNLGYKAIVLASTGVNDSLKQFVDAFNNSKNGFRITINDYSDEIFDGDSEKAWAALKEDLVSGYSPDLVLNTTGYDESFCLKMGEVNKFVDLKSILKNDSVTKHISFSDKSISLFYDLENIYSIVPSYTYRTAICSSDLYGRDQSWDENGLLSVYKPIAETRVLFFGDTKQIFLDRILEYGGYLYINYSDKTCSFDSDGFKQYLEIASLLPSDIDEASVKQFSAENAGSNILYDITGYSLGDLNLESIYSAKGDFTDIGIPVASSAGSGVYVPSMSFMIISDNAYTNECWDFVKQFLSEDYQNNLTNGIPVIKSAYEVWAEDTVPRNNNMLMYEYEKDGMTYRIYAPSEEEKGYIIQHLNSCNNLQFSDYNVKVIVLDYAQQYFDGKISLDEAASSIDREVEAYLAS